MATMVVLDAQGILRHILVDGTGTAEDPFEPIQKVDNELPTSVEIGQVMAPTAGTPVQLPDILLERGVLLKALSTNNGSIFVGSSDVSSSNGFEIDKSEILFIRIDQLDKLYIVSTSNSEGICYIAQ